MVRATRRHAHVAAAFALCVAMFVHSIPAFASPSVTATSAATSTTAPTSPTAPRKLRVVATVYPLYEIASRLGKTSIHATNVLPNNAFAEPTEKQREQLQNADVVFALSEGQQPLLDPTLSSLHNVVRVWNADEGLQPWQVPQLQWEATQRVYDVLARALPNHTNALNKAKRLYGVQLSALDRNVGQLLSTCASRTFTTTSHHVDRFAKAYRLEPHYVASVEEHGAANTVYADSLPPLVDAHRLFRATGVRVAALDDGASQPDQARRGGMDYQASTMVNVDALRSSLRCYPKWKLRK